MKYSSVFICVFGKFVFNNSQMSGEKSLRGLVDMKMMDNPVLSIKLAWWRIDDSRRLSVRNKIGNKYKIMPDY